MNNHLKILIVLLLVAGGLFIFLVELAEAGACGWCVKNGYDSGKCVRSKTDPGDCDYIWHAPQWCMGTAPFKEWCCCYFASCTPETCGLRNCGTFDDGCGDTINCGTCSGSTQCGYGECKDDEKPVWECSPSGFCNYSCSYSSSCCTSRSYKACFGGDVWWYDSCDNRETKYDDCGAKSKSCGYGTCDPLERPDWSCSLAQCVYDCSYSSSCEGEGPCTPETCSSLGKECGSWDDGCGNPLDCGDCSGKSTECGYDTCAFDERPSWYCDGSGQCAYNCNYNLDCDRCFPSGINENYTITRDCVIRGREGLGEGNLTIASGVTVQIDPNAILVFNPNHSISFDGVAYILISTTAKIKKEIF